MGNSRENIQRICKHYIGGATVDKKDRNCKLTKFSYKYFLIDFNCTCMGWFDTSGTSKNDNFPKVLVGHGVKKFSIEIF